MARLTAIRAYQDVGAHPRAIGGAHSLTAGRRPDHGGRGGDEGIDAGPRQVGLDRRMVINIAEDGDRVDQARCSRFQRGPRRRASPWSMSPRAGSSNEGSEADRDIRSLGDVLDDRAPVEELVEPKIGGEVQRRIEEGKQSEHRRRRINQAQPVRRRNSVTANVTNSRRSARSPVAW